MAAGVDDGNCHCDLDGNHRRAGYEPSHTIAETRTHNIGLVYPASFLQDIYDEQTDIFWDLHSLAHRRQHASLAALLCHTNIPAHSARSTFSERGGGRAIRTQSPARSTFSKRTSRAN